MNRYDRCRGFLKYTFVILVFFSLVMLWNTAVYAVFTSLDVKNNGVLKVDLSNYMKNTGTFLAVDTQFPPVNREKPFKIKVADPSVCSLDKSFRLKAKKKGTTTVTCTGYDYRTGKKKTVKFTVKVYSYENPFSVLKVNGKDIRSKITHAGEELLVNVKSGTEYASIECKLRPNWIVVKKETYLAPKIKESVRVKGLINGKDWAFVLKNKKTGIIYRISLNVFYDAALAKKSTKNVIRNYDKIQVNQTYTGALKSYGINTIYFTLPYEMLVDITGKCKNIRHICLYYKNGQEISYSGSREWRKTSTSYNLGIVLEAGSYKLEFEAGSGSGSYTLNVKSESVNYYWLGGLKKIKLNGSYLELTGYIYDSNHNKIRVDKKKFKIDKKVRSYSGEDGYFFSGKQITRSEIVKICKQFIKKNFPSPHIWVKNRKIIAFGESA